MMLIEKDEGVEFLGKLFQIRLLHESSPVLELKWQIDFRSKYYGLATKFNVTLTSSSVLRIPAMLIGPNPKSSFS
jgi:hypothetical protein